MNQYQAFYTYYADDGGADDVDHGDPEPMSLERACDELLPRLSLDSDFFGLVDAHAATFQVMWHDDKGYWAELITAPQPGDRRLVYRIYGGWLDRAALERTMRRLPATFAPSDFPDFAEQSS